MCVCVYCVRERERDTHNLTNLKGRVVGQKCSGREIPKAVRSRIFIIIPFLYSFFLGVIYSIMIDCLEFQLDFLLSRIFLSLVWFQPFRFSTCASSTLQVPTAYFVLFFTFVQYSDLHLSPDSSLFAAAIPCPTFSFRCQVFFCIISFSSPFLPSAYITHITAAYIQAILPWQPSCPFQQSLTRCLYSARCDEPLAVNSHNKV